MAVPEQVAPLPTCILPIFGIPGSGKTLLTQHLVVSADVALQWNLIAVHFDDLYPPDLRSQEELLAQSKGEEATADRFFQKSARQEVNACLEHLIVLNNLGGSSCSNEIAAVPAAEAPPKWEKFVSCACSSIYNRKEVLDKKGRIHHNYRRPTVLLLDDNMALRSMRYEYYQMARKYHLSFAEVCVNCTTSVAVERNSKRMIPILHSTVERMEQRLELPDPVNYHWEQRSIVISSEGDREQYLRNACEAILPLVEDAFAHPVPPLPEGNPELQESCRVANLESYVHQADNVLRKCVSTILKEYSGSKPKVFIAQQANSVRKQLLEELRMGRLANKPLEISVGPASAEFRDLLEETFTREVQNFI